MWTLCRRSPQLDRLVRLLSLPLPDFPAHYNIRPSQTVPVIRDTGNGPEWASMRWGLIPHWAKEAKTGYSTFNARVETAAQKPAFPESWAHRRCITPATGFYEWQPLETGKKQPWYFESTDGQVLAFGAFSRLNLSSLETARASSVKRALPGR